MDSAPWKILGICVISATIVWPAPAAFAAEESTGRISAMQWEIGPPPCSFRYGGVESASLLAKWPRTEQTLAAPGGEIHRIVYIEREGGLRVSVEVRTFADFDAVEWVMRFANLGSSDSPILEDILPLRWDMSVQVPPPIQEDIGRRHDMGGTLGVVLRYARGSTADVNDFEPLEKKLDPGAAFEIHSNGGRSSNGTMPFFNLMNGDHGVIGAIGWSGNWSAGFTLGPSGRAVTLSAGMQHTHLRLHPGEEIRTPRMLLLNWQGDPVQAHNVWRRLILAHYSPHENGRPVVGPACLASWGNEAIARKLARVRSFAEKRIPVDVYWIDAGWFGREPYQEGSTVYMTPWKEFRGSWWPNPTTYPNGFQPLGDLLKQEKIGFLVWVEPEEADPGTTLLTEHPDWFLRPAGPGASLLDLGNPKARRGITDLVSRLIEASGITWYREDFNTNPEGFWARADAPDRIGMTESKWVEGLYQFWDDLVARHPGLKIDNCASGGRRIDLETISRSFAFARSDLNGHTADAAPMPIQTGAISLWAPLTAGWCDGNSTYDARSAYAAALVIDDGISVRTAKDDAWLKNVIEEFHEVRGYFEGDFYPLMPYSLAPGAWTAWQFHRPDLNAGIVMFFRRKDSPITTIAAGLHGLEPDGLYSVDIRSGEAGQPAASHYLALGEALAADRLEVTLSNRPGAALVLYRRVPQSVALNNRRRGQ